MSIDGSTSVVQTGDIVARVVTGAGGTGDILGGALGGGGGVGPEDNESTTTDEFGSNDVSWNDEGITGAGDPLSIYVDDCNSDVPVSVQFFDEPTAPVSYSGAATAPSGGFSCGPEVFNGCNNSILPFIAATDDYYQATVSLTQGALSVGGIDLSEDQTVTSSSTFLVGNLSTGQSYDLALQALDGPQADWNVSLSPVPVAISAVSASPNSGPGGKPVTVSYTVSGDATLNASVENTSGQVVDTLASGLGVAQGHHTLTWGGTGSSGAPLPAGAYTVKLTSIDTQGNVSTGSANYEIPPVACSRTAARSAVAGTSLGGYMSKLAGPVSNSHDWGIQGFFCHDFTGQPDMVAQFQCCTVDSPTPLAIFRAVDNRWRLVYSWTGVSYDLRLRGNSLIEARPIYTKSSPGLCCASYYDYWTLKWNGRAFVAKQTGRSKPLRYSS